MNVQLVNSLAQIINSLTPEERKSLAAQLNESGSETSKVFNIDDEPFIGMWRDRQDLADSSQWVKQLRQSEWSTEND